MGCGCKHLRKSYYGHSSIALFRAEPRQVRDSSGRASCSTLPRGQRYPARGSESVMYLGNVGTTVGKYPITFDK